MFTFALPALHERPDDIERLARHFLARFSRKYRRRVPELARDAVERMRNYRWPGNIRELSHVMENLILLTDSGTVHAHHLGLSTGADDTAPSENSPGVTGYRFDFYDPDCTLASTERMLIEQALERTEGNVSEAAKLLGLSRGALRRRLDSMNIEK